MKTAEFKKMRDQAQKEYEEWAERHQNNSTVITNAQVLLDRWAKDTDEMARALIEFDELHGGYWYHTKGFSDAKSFTINIDVAIKAEIAYLNSAAEVAK